MREMLFRGKRIDNGEWVYGFLYETAKSSTYNAESFILEKEGLTINYRDSKGVTTYVEFIQVDPLTVGQYTGLTDKNGKKIFEGDIVKETITLDYSHTGRIYYDSDFCQWRIRFHDSICPVGHIGKGRLYQIIGNIHDNPDLLKGEKT